MQIKPVQLRKLIDETRCQWLRNYSNMEQYEAIIHDHVVEYTPGFQHKMQQDLVLLREQLRKNNEITRKKTNQLEECLAADEAANGWKGEDRFVELCI
jgi:hypothetical protein